VRRPDIGSAEHTPFRIEPEAGKVAEHAVKPSSDECGNVLDEHEPRSALVDDAGVLSPESRALAVEACARAGKADVLAREAASDEIHDSTPRASVEGADVIPDRRRIQGLVRHPCHESGRGESFPLDVTHGAGASEGESNAQVEPSDA
jgi:hypothetical protein